MKKSFLIILISSISYTSSNKYLIYENLNIDKKAAMKNYSSSVSAKLDNINLKLDKEYMLGKKVNSGELFLEEIEGEYEEENFKFKISNDFEYVDNELYNNINLGIDSIKKSDSNIFEMGAYTSYNIKKNNTLFHGFSIGVEANAKNLESGINLYLLSEYNFEKISKDRNNNYILGGASLKLKKELGSLIYIEPDIRGLYSFGMNDNLKFNETNIEIKSKSKFIVGGRLKIGIENKGDTLYNFHILGGIDKKINFDDNFLLKFKNGNYTTTINHNKLDYILGVGGDVEFNKRHRLNTSLRTIFSNGLYKYLINVGYSFEK